MRGYFYSLAALLLTTVGFSFSTVRHVKLLKSPEDNYVVLFYDIFLDFEGSKKSKKQKKDFLVAAKKSNAYVIATDNLTYEGNNQAIQQLVDSFSASSAQQELASVTESDKVLDEYDFFSTRLIQLCKDEAISCFNANFSYRFSSSYESSVMKQYFKECESIREEIEQKFEHIAQDQDCFAATLNILKPYAAKSTKDNNKELLMLRILFNLYENRNKKIVFIAAGFPYMHRAALFLKKSNYKEISLKNGGEERETEGNSTVILKNAPDLEQCFQEIFPHLATQCSLCKDPLLNEQEKKEHSEICNSDNSLEGIDKKVVALTKKIESSKQSVDLLKEQYNKAREGLKATKENGSERARVLEEGTKLLASYNQQKHVHNALVTKKNDLVKLKKALKPQEKPADVQAKEAMPKPTPQPEKSDVSVQASNNNQPTQPIDPSESLLAAFPTPLDVVRPRLEKRQQSAQSPVTKIIAKSQIAGQLKRMNNVAKKPEKKSENAQIASTSNSYKILLYAGIAATLGALYYWWIR